MSKIPGLLAAAMLFLPFPASALTQRETIDALTEAVKLKLQTSEVEVTWEAPPLESLLGVQDAKDLDDFSLQIPENARLLGEGAIPLRVLRKGVPYRTIYPRVLVQAFGRAVIAKRSIRRGEGLSSENAELAKRDLKDLSNGSLSSLDALQGSRAKRDIPAGMALTGGMIDLPFAVKSGSMVTVQVVSGDLTVIGTGQALSDGQPGQLIRVRNSVSRREFSGRVIGESLVEVQVED